MNTSFQTASEQSPGRFGNAQRLLGHLDANVISNLITTTADVVLVMDENGLIEDAAFANEELLNIGRAHWIGKPWGQTVTEESRNKVNALLRDVADNKGTKWRQLNQSAENGTDLPLSYSVISVPSGHTDGRMRALAFGRDLRPQAALQQKVVNAQRAMERDYWHLKNVETRYRLLFQVSSEAMLILNADTEKLEDSNPAAFELLGGDLHKSGWSISSSLDKSSSAALSKAFAELLASGQTTPVSLILPQGGIKVSVHISLFRQEKSSHFLLRLIPNQTRPALSANNQTRQLLSEVMESAPDALVVTDLNGIVLSANRSFLQLAQVSNEALVQGEPLDRWLGRAGVDMKVLLSNLKQRDVVRLFATRMRGDLGSGTEVEISAVSVSSGEQPCLGFTIRDISLRLGAESKSSNDVFRSKGQMTELVGRVPLKDIVSETTDLIEQMCIEAALELTGDNRSSAAEMLGLSRQSLYVKLRRFGISVPDIEPEA
ncbi:MAG: transcriptional regulator PpsR [Pseudomonadota bacterium]|jgi:transcriptional regulator PpsR